MKGAIAALILVAGGLDDCNGSSRAVAPTTTQTTDRAVSAGSEPSPSSETGHATLTIEGMVCQGCADAVKQSLAQTDGAVSVDIDLGSGTASVSFDPSKTNVDALTSAVESIDRAPAPAFRVTARAE